HRSGAGPALFGNVFFRHTHQHLLGKRRGFPGRAAAANETIGVMPEPTSTSVTVGTLSRAADRNGQTNPYVGPRALERGEPIYGRERELLDLRDLLIAERIVLLYSPSGAGKTSLIQAGLVELIKAEQFNVLPVMRVGKDAGGNEGNRYVQSAIA